MSDICNNNEESSSDNYSPSSETSFRANKRRYRILNKAISKKKAGHFIKDLETRGPVYEVELPSLGKLTRNRSRNIDNRPLTYPEQKNVKHKNVIQNTSNWAGNFLIKYVESIMDEETASEVKSVILENLMHKNR